MDNLLVNKAYSIIEEKIVTLQLPPGELISEKTISEEIGIGRMPVREALKKLESSHLIKIMPRRGMMVTEIKLDEIFQQIELRRAIEGIVMRDAAKNSTSEEKAKFLELSKLFKEATSKGNSVEAVRVDNEFNLLSVNTCRNIFAREAIIPLHSLARRLYFINFSKDINIINKINEEHCILMKNIADGKGSEAKETSDRIIDAVEELYRKSYLDIL